MAVFPESPEVEEALHAFLVQAGEDTVLLSPVNVELETPRGRSLGESAVLLADVPWSYLPLFRKGPGRSQLRVIRFQKDGVLARPIAASVEAAASEWVQTMLDPETANEYASAQEGDVPEEDLDGEPLSTGPADEDVAGARPTGHASEVAQLRAQVARLEQLLHTHTAARDIQPRAEERHEQAILFGRNPGPQTLSSADFARLQQVAGPAPRRLGKTEAAGSMMGVGQKAFEEVAGAEADRGVVDMEGEEQALASELETSLAQTADPIQKMLMLQLKQTQELVKALTGRQQAQDPISAMLGGSDSGSGSSGGSTVSVKGYAAREVFLKQLTDEKKIVETIRANARSELGLATDRDDSSLLKMYLEQRVPVGDHKTFAQIGFMLAAGWEMGVASNNQQLLAFCGRMFVYVEQACLDGGRTSLAWLLTGLPEPNFQQLALNRKRATLTPFSRLAPATWVAANVSYLKDVELFETRLKQLNVSRAVQQPAKESDAEDREPKPKPRPKKGKGAKGTSKGEGGAEVPQ